MIKIDNLCYSFPQKDLFHNISFTLETGSHCAFIGVSGSGKSTLIDIIMHPDRYMYDGSLEMAPDCRIGYVSQFQETDKTQSVTVFDYIAETSLKLKKELNDICTAMETATELDELLERYQETLDAFEALGGEDFESIILKQLNAAELTRHKDLLLSELSGGEFKLVQVMKEMFKSPNLLIMDEPDGFLDFEHLNALVTLINTYKGTLLVVTHNRYLLNHCFNKIIHLENKELQEFDGRYIDYNFSLLAKKIELQEMAQADTDEIERNNELIDRLRTAATNFADAGRGKALKARVKLQERLEARRIKAPFVEIKQPDIQLATNQPLADLTALKVDDYSVAFNEPLLEKVSFEIQANEKVALIGPNGSGKTTLLRELFKNDNSAVQFAPETETGYLSQMQGEMMDESQSILEACLDLGFKNASEVLAHLSGYGFTKAILDQKINSLSGGEKNLLQLAKLSLGNANFLLLDEPTSHLDLYAQLALEKALKDYNGTILMISHDFYTIANCMDYVLLIEDKGLRKMSIRKFRKTIYANHFNKDYLELEQKKKSLEMDIARALEANDFEKAKVISEKLETLIKLL